MYVPIVMDVVDIINPYMVMRILLIRSGNIALIVKTE